MLKSSLRGYNDTYIIASGAIMFDAAGANDRAKLLDKTNKRVIFTNCVIFTDCMRKMNATQIYNEKYLNVMMLMHNSIEYSDNYRVAPKKCPYFSLAITNTKIRTPSRFFSPQLLEVYRILLVEATLESIMFYYTFSVINTMFIPCTALLCAATRTLKLSTTPLSISCGIHLISLLMISFLVCELF